MTASASYGAWSASAQSWDRDATRRPCRLRGERARHTTRRRPAARGRRRVAALAACRSRGRLRAVGTSPADPQRGRPVAGERRRAGSGQLRSADRGRRAHRDVRLWARRGDHNADGGARAGAERSRGSARPDRSHSPSRRYRPPTRRRCRRAATARGPLRVLYAGTVGLAQGLDTLVEGARLAGPEVVDVIVAGSGADAGAVRERVRRDRIGNVNLLGVVSPGQIGSLYAETEAVAVLLREYIPLLSGALPTKLVEAMLAGRAVVFSGKGESGRARRAQRGRARRRTRGSPRVGRCIRRTAVATRRVARTGPPGATLRRRDARARGRDRVWGDPARASRIGRGRLSRARRARRRRRRGRPRPPSSGREAG